MTNRTSLKMISIKLLLQFLFLSINTAKQGLRGSSTWLEKGALEVNEELVTFPQLHFLLRQSTGQIILYNITTKC